MTDLEILKRWIQLEFILDNYELFRGRVWSDAYNEQLKLYESVWFIVFGEARSISEWVNAYYKEQE